MNAVTILEMTQDEARETDRLIKRHINTTRYLLLDMRDRKGWKALGYESFKEYGEKELGYKETHIYQLVDAAEISLQLGYSPDSAIAESPPKETHLRPLKAVDDEEVRKQIWEEATRKAEEEHAKLTAKRVEEAVAEWKQRQQESQEESNERRKKIRELEQELNNITALPEPEIQIVEKVPEDYETTKQLVTQLNADLADLRQKQLELVQKQVVEKLKERQNEIDALENQAKRLETVIKNHQEYQQRISDPSYEMKHQVDAVEKFVQACSFLASGLTLFEHTPDEATKTKWKAAKQAASDAAMAIEMWISRPD